MTARTMTRVLFTVLSVCLTIVVGTPAQAAEDTNKRPKADFNNDGAADLAIGVPYENKGDGNFDGGVAQVLYGSDTGLNATGNDYWHQDAGLEGVTENYDYFGATLAAGDFDGNGAMDLAVGVPGEDVGSVTDAGAVNVIYGRVPGGLEATDNQVWHEDQPGMLNSTSEPNDQFGDALAAGDFNGDGFDDLAIGVPYEDVASTIDAGAVVVLYGSAVGLTADDDEWWHENAEEGDWFGTALASADFDQDGYDDLAVGIPGEDLPDSPDDIISCGAVEILWGSAGGLSTRVSLDFWHQDRSGVPDVPEDYDFFGSTLTTGDFDGDGYPDLAIGVPYEDVVPSGGGSEVINAGYVHVLYGSAGGVIVKTYGDYFHQDKSGVSDFVEENDRFGESLAAGDFDNDGYSDLVVGVPSEGQPNGDNMGEVHVFFGSSVGATVPDDFWMEYLLNNFAANQTDAQFGFAVAAGDFNRDGHDDLAIGTPFKDISSTDQAGIVYVLPGTNSGLSANNSYWYQGSAGVQGSFEIGDRFGYALAAIPRGDAIFRDGFESGNMAAWD